MKNNLQNMRHSTAHLMAYAVKKLYPNVKIAIGPVIENGFYYDFEFKNPISEKDLLIIENIMKDQIKANLLFTQKWVSIKQAKQLFKNEKYKLEIIKEIEKGERDDFGKKGKVSIYKLGEFTDLCKGPHLKNTKEIGEFKLFSIAGAYWKGDEKNIMLTRIYGTCFENMQDLKKYLDLLEEAKKRDHRKIGKDLDLFCFSDLVGPGLPLFTPKGTIIKEGLQKFIEKICRNYDFQKVITPHIAKNKLFELSGHAEKFSEEAFHVSSKRKHKFVMKPVQCPHQTQIYASKLRSYKNLPIRYMESEKQYRAEKQGEIGGLNRVYAITVEDGHSFCSIDQVKDEIKIMINIIKEFYGPLGLLKKYWVSLSVRDYNHPEKYIGEPKDWDKCEQILQEVSNEMKLDAKRCEGEAALYGPKLDFMFKDALGKEIQIPTVQIDFATAKRFNLIYIDKNGKEVTPVIVHRAILGSYERLLALLIEYFKGAFPLWLSPVQVDILPISDKFIKYAQKIHKVLKENDIRSEVNSENKTLGSKIRTSTLQKTPYMIIIGEKETKSKPDIKTMKISVRTRKGKDLGLISLYKFINSLKEQIEKKV